VARFEEMFRKRVEARHAVALGSCTAALHLSLLAAGVGKGDEVITTPMTFCATANSIVHTGARPVFVDVQAATGNIDPVAVEAAIGPRSAAILPVHLAGRPCDMDRLESIARRHGLVLIEDAAHAAGAAWQGRPIGSIGDATCFSFYVTKNLVTGEGGMVTTEDGALAAKVLMLSRHGMSQNAWERFSVERYRHYEVSLPGFKYAMTDLQAALGIHQLGRLGQGEQRRLEVWDRYDDALAELPLERPAPIEEGTVHARHLYSVLIDTEAVGRTRDEIVDALIALRIGTGVHYVPLHLHPWYREAYGYRPGAFPSAERIGERTLSLPLSAKLTDRDVDSVVAALRRVMHRAGRRGAA
jgi:dTDP-4-amino-4,6-dideoxygalactose transaminase